MSGPGRVLVVEDDSDFIEMYQDILAEEGYFTRVAKSRAEAKRILGSESFDAIILDQKLQGDPGPDDGVDLLGEANMAGAKVILATAYASDEAIKRAFALGAYDYIEKTPRLSALLRIKLRNIMELATERLFATTNSSDIEALILKTWNDLREETNSAQKGRMLELLLLMIFRSIKGFEQAHRDVASIDEQFDIVIPNRAEHAPWNRESSYFIVECKNWSSRVGPEELDRFFAKLERRNARASLGFLVSVGGFTSGIHTTHATYRGRPMIVVLISGADLESLVRATDRGAALAQLHERATMGGAPTN